MAILTRRRLLAAACAAPLGVHAPKLLAQDADPRPAVFLIGDSIIRNDYDDNGGTNLQWGWGHMMKWRFNTMRMHVVNDAFGGTSSRSFMDSPNFWPKVKRMIRAGDYVLIGFGHNDPSGSLRGNGEELGVLPPRAPLSPAVAAQLGIPTPPASPPRPATPPALVHSFGWYLREYVRQIRVLGATPIIMSRIPLGRFADGKVTADGRDYATWAKEAADQVEAPFIPLFDLVTEAWNKLGQEKVRGEYFPQGESGHPNWKGAVLISGLVADAIRQLDTPLKGYLLPTPNVPEVPDIAPPIVGDLGPVEMKPRTRTPSPV